jgi:hypothetical protein
MEMGKNMTKEQLAEAIDGRKYGDEITPGLREQAKESGLVVVFGASDDLMEFDGAICEEVGCYGGVMAYLGETGLWESECADEECPYAKRGQAKCKTILAVRQGKGNPAWTYETEIPHAKFNIYEDEELYCIGIVFEISALS